MTCPECACPYDDALLECPECACPNPQLSEEVCAQLLEDEQKELEALAQKREQLLKEQEENARLQAAKDPALSLIRTLRRVFVRCDDFHTRSRRSEFWTFVLFNVALSWILYFVMFSEIGRDYVYISAATSQGEYWQRLLRSCLSDHLLMSLVLIVYGLLIFLPTVSVTVRRLHDINFSGLWILLGIAPLIMGVIIEFCPYYGIIALTFLLLLDSVGDNKYGRRHAY